MSSAHTAPSTRPVQMLDLAAERESLGPALADAVQRVLNSGQYVLGPEVERFERDFAAAHRAAHGIGVASGTDALVLALRALGVGPGDRVLTSAFSFFASAAAIAWLGAQPVLVDVEEDTALLDPERVAETLERDARRDAGERPIRCILPVHLYGQLVDLTAFERLARAHGTTLLEDAAQAHGAERGGRRAGEVGDATAFSFYPTKNLGCAGEGGIILTPDSGVAERVRRLRDHGSHKKYEHDEIGTNSRLQSIQAAVLNVKLPHLDAWNDRRRQIAALYDELLTDSGNVTPLKKGARSRPVYHQYTVRVPAEKRATIAAEMLAAGVQTAVHYPRAVHMQTAAATWGYSPGRFPVAEALAREVLCLPVHPFLQDADVERTAAVLRRAARR